MPTDGGFTPTRIIHVRRTEIAEAVAGTAQLVNNRSNTLLDIHRSASDGSSGSITSCSVRPTNP
jgi:hypothetical protein